MKLFKRPFIARGACRVVLLTKNYAVKFPNFLTGRPASVVFGLMENLQERYWLVSDYSQRTMTDAHPLAKIHFADPLGLFVVMERCRPLTGVEWVSGVAADAVAWADGLRLAEDVKRSNFGVTVDGRCVFIDYGYSTRTRDIGDPAFVVNGVANRPYIKLVRATWKFFEAFWRILERLNIAVADDD